ncbi:MAG: fumarylacetoacetate hydrolase family protein, partial [Pseudobdellovibrionaceae bacterium]
GFKKLDECRDLRLRLWVNDELRQEGRTSQMIFGFEEIIEFATEHFPVCPGDLLLTGTPAGVGPIRAGDRVKAEIEGQITHTWKVLQESPPAPK